jgi:ABC-type uncharacterized transport system permease subunit
MNLELDRVWVSWAALFFLVAFVSSAYSLGTGRHLVPRFTFALILAGFICQTIFLAIRGHALGRCPITSYFEVLVFMSWSMVLVYLVVGSAYRLSLLGAFTAPIATVTLCSALLLPRQPIRPRPSPSPWLEAHTSFSLIACGTFALACVAGVMYLIQERQLKTRSPGSLFFRLPPITALTVANTRLIWLGFGLLTVALASGFFVGQSADWKKVLWSLIVWCLYGGILFVRARHTIAAKWIAMLSILAFSLLLSTFLGIRFSGSSL